MKKYSEVYDKNFFELRTIIPGRRLVYYLDYQANGRSRAKTLFEEHNVRKWNKSWRMLVFANSFALIGAYIKASDMEAFEKCMKILEDTAPFFCTGYKEARIAILDSMIVLKETPALLSGSFLMHKLLIKNKYARLTIRNMIQCTKI